MGSTIEALQGSDIEGDDPTYFDAESSVGWTASITSSIVNYHEENGRRYHAYQAGKYALPNDEEEQERMDIQYHAIRLLFNDQAFFAPIKNPGSILDVGTGTGIWAIDVGDKFPCAEVIGTDLSPIQPKWVPPNVKFEVDDLTLPWTYPANRFDFIHTRLMSGSSVRDWGSFCKQAYKHLKPGGWLECQEFDLLADCDDGTLPPNSKITAYCHLLEGGCNKGGFSLRLKASTLRDHLLSAGFTSVVVKEFKLPIGPWAKDPQLRQAGAAQLVALLDGLFGISVAIFTRYLGWTVEEVQVCLAGVREEWKLRGVHSYWPIYVVYGRKPENAEAGEAAEA